MTTTSPGLVAFALLGLVTVACGEPPPPEWHEEGTHRWRALRLEGGREPGFTRLPPSRTGVTFSNAVTREQLRRNQNLLGGSGVALGDVDGDGRLDVYLARLEGPNALYLNRGDWRFEEVAEARGVRAPDRFSTGAVLADVDGDTDLDLFVTALGGPNALFVNDGTGRFREETAAAGLESDHGSMTAALADIDGDGDLDLHVANYKVRNATDVFPPWERTFSAVTRRVDDTLEIVPRMREHYRLVRNPERGITAKVQRADPNAFYVNDGDGRFERLSWTSGRFLDEEGHALERPPEWFTLAARFYDVDSDGDQDLYSCNDFEDPDLFWMNEGDGRFRLIPRLSVRATSNACMAVDFGDIERDGDVDYFAIDMLSRDPLVRRRQQPSHTALPKLVGRITDRPQKQRNTLFLNRGDATFAEIARFAGVQASGWSWSTMFLDVDLDGYEDLLVGNGNEQDVQDLDATERVREAFKRAYVAGRRSEWRELRFMYPELHTENVAFRNGGDLTFREVGAEWGWAPEADVSHGMASGDLDGDGDQDVVVNRLRSPALLMRNDAAAPRVKVRLLGDPPNTRGIGARVRVSGGPVDPQQRELTAGGLYLSSSAPELTFAAGSPGEPGRPADSLTIRVRWPDGGRTVVRGARPNRVYEIRQSSVEAPGGDSARRVPDSSAYGVRGSDTAAGTRSRYASTTGASRPVEGPYFAPVELDHEHVDSLYEDRSRQPLLPFRLSQLGPGVSWYDADGDGDEELLVSSGRGGRLAYFRNDDGALRRVRTGLAPASHDQTTVLGAPPPGGAGSSLIMGLSGYETPASDSTEVASAVELAAGSSAGRLRVRTALPGSASATGPLAMADIEGDGDLDLFVGGRVIPGRYPRPASSRIYRRDEDAWVLDEENAELLDDVGLVSAAVFSDVDSDGDADLLLAVEWGPVKLFLNRDGELREVTRSWGLEDRTSRWNGITTGDLNGDGRMDVVATSWGRNTDYRVSGDDSLFVYHGDFDRNGTLDLLMAQRGARGGREGIYPLEHPLQIGEALPGARRRLRSYGAFAGATVEEVMGRPTEDVGRLSAVTMDHTLFLNAGDRFEAVSLPRQAQLAPAFHAAVADFDGDGKEDLFLSQNFFPTAPETPRYDAGRGLWLRGDGAGGLEPVPGQSSGVKVYGDQRGAALADYDDDGRVDLAVSQNGAGTRLYRNVGGEPGLRIGLEGPPGNPSGVGSHVWLVYEDGTRGPSREIHAGAGYWSMGGPEQVLGRDSARTPASVRVRWPGGETSRVPVEAGTSEVTVAHGSR